MDVKVGHLNQQQKIESLLLRCTYIEKYCIFPGPKKLHILKSGQDEKRERIAAPT